MTQNPPMSKSPFESSAMANDLTQRVSHFMESEVYLAEATYYAQKAASGNRWTWQPILRKLRAKAKAHGLWVFPMDREVGGMGLSLLGYAPVAEMMSTSPIGTEVFNCYTGMIGYIKLIHPHATAPVKDRFLHPLGEKMPRARRVR
jgi:acyl-CoA dehydrogenase